MPRRSDLLKVVTSTATSVSVSLEGDLLAAFIAPGRAPELITDRTFWPWFRQFCREAPSLAGQVAAAVDAVGDDPDEWPAIEDLIGIAGSMEDEATRRCTRNESLIFEDPTKLAWAVLEQVLLHVDKHSKGPVRLEGQLYPSACEVAVEQIRDLLSAWRSRSVEGLEAARHLSECLVRIDDVDRRNLDTLIRLEVASAASDADATAVAGSPAAAPLQPAPAAPPRDGPIDGNRWRLGGVERPLPTQADTILKALWPPGRQVTTEDFVEAVWGDESKGSGTVSGAVSRFNRAASTWGYLANQKLGWVCLERFVDPPA